MAMKNPVHPGAIVREDWGKAGTVYHFSLHWSHGTALRI